MLVCTTIVKETKISIWSKLSCDLVLGGCFSLFCFLRFLSVLPFPLCVYTSSVCRRRCVWLLLLQHSLLDLQMRHTCVQFHTIYHSIKTWSRLQSCGTLQTLPLVIAFFPPCSEFCFFFFFLGLTSCNVLFIYLFVVIYQVLFTLLSFSATWVPLFSSI